MENLDKLKQKINDWNSEKDKFNQTNQIQPQKKQPNFLIKNIQNINDAARTNKLPCFIGNTNSKGEIIIKPYTINSAITNLPIADLNQLYIQQGFRMMGIKSTKVITRGEARAIGTDIEKPEKDFIGITRENPTTKKQEVIRFYPVTKVKNQEKVQEYSKNFMENQKGKFNISLSDKTDIKIDCTQVKDFKEFWGKYKTAAMVHGELICSKHALETARASLNKDLNELIETGNYSKNYSYGKELERSYQKELRQAFPRPVQRKDERERQYEQEIKFDGIDR